MYANYVAKPLLKLIDFILSYRNAINDDQYDAEKTHQKEPQTI